MNARLIDLRNQFAMAALPMLIRAWGEGDGEGYKNEWDSAVAKQAFSIADAMLVESEKVKSDNELHLLEASEAQRRANIAKGIA